jgi:hypothetical protein
MDLVHVAPSAKSTHSKLLTAKQALSSIISRALLAREITVNSDQPNFEGQVRQFAAQVRIPL